MAGPRCRWTKSVRAAGAALALAACEPGAAPPGNEVVAGDAQEVVDPGELVALADGNDSAERLVARAEEHGYRVKKRDTLQGLDLVLLTFRLPPYSSAESGIRRLEALEPGVSVGRNHAYSMDPGAGSGRTARTYADELLGWPAGGCPARIAIGVIDTPLDPDAPGLHGVAITSRDFTEASSRINDTHGTAVAELLAGPGRLRDTRLFHAAVVGDVPDGDPAAGVDDIIRAVDWLYASGVRLVNVSLAGPYNKILDRGLRAAVDRGLIVVAAAGNDGPYARPRYPAAFDHAIAVSAVDAELEAYEHAPRGDHIDVTAPGVDIFVSLDGEGRYMSGTSIAAPFVTASIAADPNSGRLKSADQARARLAHGARDLGQVGRDDVFGMGLAMTPPPCRRPMGGEVQSG